MTEQVNMVYMKQLMFDGLVGNLTAELRGAARFYGSRGALADGLREQAIGTVR